MEKILLLTGASSEVGMEVLKSEYRNYDLIYAQYFHMNDKLAALVEKLGKEVEIVLLEANFSDTNSLNKMIDAIKEKGKLPNHIVHLPALCGLEVFLFPLWHLSFC